MLPTTVPRLSVTVTVAPVKAAPAATPVTVVVAAAGAGGGGAGRASSPPPPQAASVNRDTSAARRTGVAGTGGRVGLAEGVVVGVLSLGVV